MYSHFDGYNFVRLVCPLALGIIAYVYWGLQIPFVKLIFPVSFLVLILLNSTRSIRSSFNYTILYGLALNLGLLAFGNHLAVKSDSSLSPEYFGNHIEKTSYLTIQIEKPFVKKSKYYKSIAQVKNRFGDEIKVHKNQKLYINLKEVDETELPQYGDVLIIKNKLFEIEAPKNPGGFDYQRFSKLKKIYFQTYISPADYQVICNSCGSILWSTIYQLRRKLMHSLELHINDRAVLAITSALLLGQKDYITPEIQEMYADTGAMHILAVSGLHVGILLMLLTFILKPLGARPGGKALKALIIIAIIWIYAGITGFAPSVTRAALMFSLYLVGDVLNRSKNIYNVLAASAFLILLFKPNMIAEVGFQLSYAAVFSIVWLYPYIYHTFFFSNRVIDFFWSISAVSLAAQIGTFPISLYYFHQFPVTFFIANLVAIPSATVIFIGGVGLLFSGFISIKLAAIIGLFLESVIQSLNFVLHNLEQLPFATFQFNQVAFYIPFLLALIFIGTIKWLITNRRFGLVMASSCVLFICFSYSLSKLKTYNQKHLVIYHDYKNVIAELIAGKSYSLLTNKKNRTEKLNRYLFKPAHQYYGTSNQKQPNPYTQNLFFIEEQTVLLINNSNQYIADLPFQIDLLVLSNNPYVNILELKNKLNLKQVVFAADNYQYNINRWKKECDALGLSFYNIKEEGALVWEINNSTQATNTKTKSLY